LKEAEFIVGLLRRASIKVGAAILCLFCFTTTLGIAAPIQGKKVLLLYSYSSDIPVQSLYTQGIQNQLQKNSEFKIDYMYEYLDLAKYPSDTSFSKALSQFLKDKYALNRPDLIITHFEPAGKFLTEYGAQTFPGVPAVLGLYEGEGEKYPDPPPNYRSVVGIFGMESAVRLIQQTQPAVRKVYVIAGDSDRERKAIASFAAMTPAFANQLEFIYLNKQPFHDMLDTVKTIGDDAAILYIYVFRDAAGNDFVPGEALKQLHQVAQAPIYSSVSIFIGMGTVGGYMSSQSVLGSNVADVGYDILRGRISEHIPVEKKVAAEYIFDWRELKRWKINKSSLPAGSRIEFRQTDLWETYRWQLIIAIALFLLQALLIGQLLWNQKRRQLAEEKILHLNKELSTNLSIQEILNASLEEEIADRQQAQEAQAESEARYRAVVGQAPEAILLVDADSGEILEANDRFTERFGYDLLQDGPLSLYDITVDNACSVRIFLNTLKASGELAAQRRKVRHRNGFTVSTERSATMVHYQNRDIIAITIRDVSDKVRHEQEIQRDAQLATRIQNALLIVPEKSDYLDLSTIYQPLNYVGGDLFFMDWRYEGTLLRGFLVDATGHGLGTALHAASLHVLLREVNERDFPLADAMRWLNRRVCEYFDEATFAGALGFELDLQSRQLHWSCAGIPKIWIKSNSYTGILECPGMNLGISVNETFETHTLPIEIGDSYYFMTDGESDLLERLAVIPLDQYPEMVALLKALSTARERRDDAAAICIQVHSLPQHFVRQEGWPRILHFNGYGDYHRFKNEIAKILMEVTQLPHSLHEVAVNEAIANAMECRDGVPRQHKSRLSFNKIGNWFIVRVKSSRMGFAGNAILRRLRSHPEEMFSYGEDAAMGRGIPMMLSMTHRMIYNSDGTELLLAWRLKQN
jgi:PAS domain S-box-containing protein